MQNDDLVVTDKYTNKPATRVALADSKAIDQGIAASVLAAPEMEDMPFSKGNRSSSIASRDFERDRMNLPMRYVLRLESPSRTAKARSVDLLIHSKLQQRSQCEFLESCRLLTYHQERRATEECGSECRSDHVLSFPLLTSR